MASKAQAGKGTAISMNTVAVNATGAANFVRIGEINSSPLKAPKWQQEDVTSFDSLNDMEYLTTIRGDGSCTLSMNRVGSDAGQQAVSAAAADGSLHTFNIVLPLSAGQNTTGDMYTFNAYVLSSGDLDVAPTKKVSLSIDLKISGPVTFTPGN